MNKQIDEMKSEIESYNKSYKSLKVMISEIELKLTGLQVRFISITVYMLIAMYVPVHLCMLSMCIIFYICVYILSVYMYKHGILVFDS